MAHSKLINYYFAFMKKITLTKGQFAFIDNEDIDLISTSKWCAVKSKYQTSFYAQRRIIKDGKSNLQFMHQLIAEKHKIITSSNEICDHIDRNGLNNQKKNLRKSTYSQNCANVGKKRSKTKPSSKYKGIVFEKSCYRWRARIKVNYKNISLGCYSTEKEAAKAYNEAAIKYFGEYAFINKI